MTQCEAISKPQTANCLPRGVEWLTVREAAVRSGESVRKWQVVAKQHLDRGDGLAREDEADRLLIRSDEDPSLARIKFAGDIAPEADVVAGLTAAQREEWAWRCVIRQRHDAAKREAVRACVPVGEATRRFIERVKAEYPGRRLSRATLDRWHEDYRAGGRGGLISGHCTREKAPEADDPFGPELLRIYRLHNGLPMARVHRIAKGLALDRGWKVWGPTKATKYIEGHTTPAERIYRRVGPDACRNTVEPHLTRDYSTIEPGDCYVGDHHQFDCIVQTGERIDTTTGEVVPILARPWLTAWLDMRTRKFVGWVIRAADPDTDSILEGLRVACLTHGVPRTIYVDCGKDYSSAALHGETKVQKRLRRRGIDVVRVNAVLPLLGIEPIQATQYRPEAKGMIERAFGTVDRLVCKLYDTYTGPNTSAKPERLAGNLAKGKYPTLQEFVEVFERVLEAEYHNAPHTGDAMGRSSPNEVWVAELRTTRTAPAELLEVMLQRRVGPVKVGRNGVRYRGLWYGAYETADLFGQEVYLRVDGRDLSKVSLWTVDDKFLCVARSNRRLPALTGSVELRAAIAERNRARKAMRGVHEARMALHLDLPDLVVRAAQARNAARRPAPTDPTPPTIAPVHSPLAAELPALQAAQRALEPASKRPAAKMISLEEVAAAFDRSAADARERREDEAARVPSLEEMVGGKGFVYERPARVLERERAEDEATARTAAFRYESPVMRKGGAA